MNIKIALCITAKNYLYFIIKTIFILSFRCHIEKRILQLGEDPYIGTNPRYSILRRQGYKVLILEKNLVFYKIDEVNKQVVVYAVIDQRQDYLNIIQGL